MTTEYKQFYMPVTFNLPKEMQEAFKHIERETKRITRHDMQYGFGFQDHTGCDICERRQKEETGRKVAFEACKCECRSCDCDCHGYYDE